MSTPYRAPSTAFRASLVIFLIGCLALSSQVALAQTEAVNQTAHLYFFTNPGCAPCRQVEPGIDALLQEGYPITKITLNQQPQMAARFLVDRTPTVILVSHNRIVGRHAGLIDGVTLKKWFAAVGVPSGSRFQNGARGTKVSLGSTQGIRGGQPPERFASRDPRAGLRQRQMPSDFDTPTMHEGTRRPGNAAERLALQATVRLRVEDPEGISYATGTVIHAHQGEYLIVTCGHVFRDAQGKGEITVEFGFDNGQVQTAPGELITYDADARDIGLVAMRSNQILAPVKIAKMNYSVQKGDNVFSIGCDHGKSPTIRRTRIKNRAAYDGAIKYDIFGRPVVGRSGGGLFNERGELIGICNAAAVEVDEGIYTALETIHWQIAHVHLEHLFETEPAPERLADRGRTMPVDGEATRTYASNRRRGDLVAITPPPTSPGPSPSPFSNSRSDRLSGGRRSSGGPTPVSWNRGEERGASQPDPSDMEVIILVRSKTDPTRTEAITVSHPSRQLLDYLDAMQATRSQPRPMDVARLRRGLQNR